VEAGQGPGAAANAVWSAAGHRDQAGPEKIPLLPLDSEADDDDDSGDDSDGEDQGSDDDYGAHEVPLTAGRRGWIRRPAILVVRPVRVAGTGGVLGTIWPGWVHPSSPAARLSPMDLAILVIPTFGTCPAYTPSEGPQSLDIPKILMS